MIFFYIQYTIPHKNRQSCSCAARNTDCLCDIDPPPPAAGNLSVLYMNYFLIIYTIRQSSLSSFGGFCHVI